MITNARLWIVALFVAGVTSGIVVACTNPGPAARPSSVELRPHRAYDGAPPTIPHEVTELGRQTCMNCHLAGDAATQEGNTAARTPHPELLNCRQCHVVEKAEDEFRANSFEGGTYRTGTRAHSTAPWLIPHPLTMRENCAVCHTSVSMDDELHTTHPERSNCRQCHVPAHEGWPGPRPESGPPSPR